MRKLSITVAAVLVLVSATYCMGQQPEKGYWVPESKDARKITGTLDILNGRIVINEISFPAAPIRGLKPEEVTSVFDVDVNTAGQGALYRLRVPARQHFQNKNTLCGTDDTQWMATYLSGPKTLEVAFFSGDDEPVFTIEAVTNSRSHCGTYTFVR